MNSTVKKSALALTAGLALSATALSAGPAMAASGWELTSTDAQPGGQLNNAVTGESDNARLLVLSDGSSIATTYCIQQDVETHDGVDYQPTSTAAIPSLDHVEGILAAGYPRTSLAELKAATGIQTLDEDEAVMATQAAIWSWSNPAQFQRVKGDMVEEGTGDVVGSQSDRDVEGLYDHLVGQTPQSEVSVWAATGYQTLVAALVDGSRPTGTVTVTPKPSTTPTPSAPSTTPAKPSTPKAPTTQPTPVNPSLRPTTPTAPAKPAKPAKPATRTVTFRVQVDTWKVRTATQASTGNAVMKDGKYAFREDVRWNTRTGRVSSAPLWAKGVESWHIDTLKVTVPAGATNAQVLAAEKAAAARHAGVAAGRTAAVRAGHTTTTAWVIPAGAWDNKTSWKVGPKTAPQLLAGSTTR